jgi:hypothetical protein
MVLCPSEVILQHPADAFFILQNRFYHPILDKREAKRYCLKLFRRQTTNRQLRKLNDE